MISWRHSFDRLNEEYEITMKKKHALDSLLSDARISQSTHDMFNEKIDEAINDIENRKRALLEKMKSRISELDQHTKTLEVLLANFEIQHVTGEIEEDVYQREISLLSIGLENARHESDVVNEALNQLSERIPSNEGNEALIDKMESPAPEALETSQPSAESTDQVVQTEETEAGPDIFEQDKAEHQDQVQVIETGETATSGSEEEQQEQSSEIWQELPETGQDAEGETPSTEADSEY